MRDSRAPMLDVPVRCSRQLGVHAAPASPRTAAASSRASRSPRIPGTRADGRKFIPDAIARGAAAVLWETRGFQWDARWHGAASRRRRPAGSARRHRRLHLRQSVARPVDGRRHRHQRQDVVRALDRAGARRLRAARGDRSARSATACVGALAPASHTTPDVDACCTSCSRSSMRAGARRSRWKCRRTASTRAASTARRSTSRCSPTSRATISTTTSTMAAYGAAKARLFAWPGLRTRGDQRRRRVRPEPRSTRRAARGQRVLTLRPRRPRTSRRRPSSLDRRGIVLDVATPWGAATLTLAGRRRVQRAEPARRARRAARERRAARRRASRRSRGSRRRPGRMQRFGGDGKPLVVVDYAHTPDALEKVLLGAAARGGATAASSSCVFGCGGDRDPGKRPQMGAIAARARRPRRRHQRQPAQRGSRRRSPNAIVQGVRDAGHRRWAIELDRHAGDRAARSRRAQGGDVVLVAGKGHETYQERSGERTPFSDAARSATPRSPLERRMMDTRDRRARRRRPRRRRNVRFLRVTTDSRALARRRSVRRAEGRALRRPRLRRRRAVRRRGGGAGRRRRASAALARARSIAVRRSAGGARPARRALARAVRRCRSSSSSAATARPRSRR